MVFYHPQNDDYDFKINNQTTNYSTSSHAKACLYEGKERRIL